MYAYGLAPLPPDADGNRLAAQWYFEAARSGHADAQYSLGILFLTGRGPGPCRRAGLPGRQRALTRRDSSAATAAS